jgi:hypothetical protein
LRHEKKQKLAGNPVPTAIDGATPVNNLKTTDGAIASKAIHTNSQRYPVQAGNAGPTPRRPTPMKPA